MKATLSFLQRMNDHLSSLSIASPFCSSVSQQCFWSFGLQSVDKKEAPLQTNKRIPKPTLSEEHDPVSFGPSNHDFGANAVEPCLEAPLSTSTTKLDLMVKRLHVASLQLKN